MSADRRVLVSPRRFGVDLSELDGVMVLGERAALLVSAVSRLEPGELRQGVTELSVTWPLEEGRALQRAMARAERSVPGDRRTPGQRDLDRFMTLVDRVLEAVGAVRAVRGQDAFRKSCVLPR